ncbi:uncharacterized protein LOC144301762 [Canis aureus]
MEIFGIWVIVSMTYSRIAQDRKRQRMKDVSSKKLLWPRSKRLLPMFSSRILMDSFLTLISMTVNEYFSSQTSIALQGPFHHYISKIRCARGIWISNFIGYLDSVTCDSMLPSCRLSSHTKIRGWCMSHAEPYVQVSE